MQAVALAPSHSDAALYLGEHLAMTGRHGAAANYFRKVQELSGDKVGLANLLHSARWLCDFETGNGNRVHVDGSVSELPGAEGVDSTVSVENRDDGGTSFVLTFSAPMDTDTVEDNFTIRSFDSTVISLDNATISGNTATPNNSSIWDQGEFDVDWNSDDTEVTFTFSERQLPSEGDGENFLVSFDGQADDDPVGWRADFNTPLAIANSTDPDGASQAGIFITRLIRAMESDPQAAATRITHLETVESPNFDFDDGFDSGNTSSWSGQRPADNPGNIGILYWRLSLFSVRSDRR